jgi:hypothetical protein
MQEEIWDTMAERIFRLGKRAVLLECEVYLQYNVKLTMEMNRHIKQILGGC